MDSKQQEAAAAVVGTPSEDSISMKTEYNPAHEVFVSEPLPAYKLKTRPTAVQIARIGAFTVIACTFIMGSFMLGAAWLQANASCSQLMHAEALLRQSEEAADRPLYQALVDPLQSDETSDSKQELPGGHQPSVRSAESQTVDAATGNEQSATPSVQIKLPLDLDIDEIVGALLEKNQRSRMNCVIEKKRAEEVMDHQPKTLRLPFGLNITTDPRFEHVTGERLSIVCESGLDERRAPTENPAEPMQQQPSMMMPIPMGGNPMTHLPNIMGPPPPPHHPHHMHHGPPPIPLAMIARINADIDNQLQLQEQQQIEEHIIPIFQQLLPELRQAPVDGVHMMREHHQEQQQHQQQQHQHHKQLMQMHEAEDRVSAMMPGKVLYHPAMAAEGRPLYTVAISDKQMANNAVDRPPPPMMMHQENGPSEAARHNVEAPMFHRVPINVPVSMMMPPPGSPLSSSSAPQDNPTDDSKPDHRPHFVHPRSVESVQEDVVQN